MANVTITKSSTSAPAQTIEVSVPQNIPSGAQGRSLPGMESILLIAAVSAVISWGVVQSVKQGFAGYAKENNKERPPWFAAALLRALSILIGALAGWLLFNPMQANGTQAWGFAIGACGGALATIIVAQIKRRIKGA